jgi:hypothetical protein
MGELLMKRPTLNFMVDAVAFTAFVLLASTGLLMHYVLPPGSGHFGMLWRMDRHEWGQLHFWIAVVLLAFLALHLFLHWRWVVCTIKSSQPERCGMRVALAVAGVTALVALAVAPFFGGVEHAAEPPHRLRVTVAGQSEAQHIDGSMTLADVERLTGIRPAVILRELGLPEDLPTDEPLGRLRKTHGFELRGVRDVVRGQGERR